jgi:hypothetical protein
MKQLEKSLAIDKIYLETFGMRSMSYPANVDAILEFFPCDIPTFNVSDVS